MLFIKAFLSIFSGKFIFSPLYGRKAEVRSPLIVLRHELIFSSFILRLNFLFKNFSKNIKVEVISQSSEFTQPPRDQGEATIKGTLYPRPTGLSLAHSSVTPFFSTSSSKVTNSSEESIFFEVFPVVISFGFGATYGGM